MKSENGFSRSDNNESFLNKSIIPFLGGRPYREGGIRKDDLLDLKIALNTSNGIDDFLQNV